MDKKKIEIIAVAVLIAVFIFILSGSLKKVIPAVRRANAPLAAALVSAPEKVRSLFEVNSAKKEIGAEAETDESGYERDPFALPQASEGQASAVSNLRLTGITTDGKGRMMAIVNGHIVSIGGKIGRFTVVNIAAKSVVVTDGKQNFELQLEQ